MGFYIGSMFIPYYGFLIFLGVVAASILGAVQIRLFRKDINNFIIIAAMAALGGIIGAKALYFIVSWREVDISRLTDFSYLNMIMGSGFVFYGGLIGGVLCLIPCRKIIKEDIFSYITICIPCVPLVHAFGRLGCSAVGCCYGIPFMGPFAIVYKNSPFAPDNIHLFPVQITEAIINFIITIVLVLYIDIHREKDKHSFSLYILMYAPSRFILEYMRYDEARGSFGKLSTSQWISIAIILAVIILQVAKSRIFCKGK